MTYVDAESRVELLRSRGVGLENSTSGDEDESERDPEATVG